ncbi:MAG: hypothetical protein KAR40_11030 [Candidatus Sabulitectum sp.]|nr:hypothetical protein [Candidatus Sabulitectum sp.]
MNNKELKHLTKNYDRLRKGVEGVVLRASPLWKKGDLGWIEGELLRLLKETK